MPYIKKERREELAGSLPSHNKPENPGELNYALTRVCAEYMERQRVASGLALPNYAIMAEVVGALEAAKLELYARVVRPYEDQKRIENGDVYHA